MSFQKILFLSPHTDDAELACGGTIIKLIEENKEVFYVAFSSAEKSVNKEYDSKILVKECLEATKNLGIQSNNVNLLDYEVRNFSYNRQDILEDLIKIRNKINPDLVFLPSSSDVHQDHQVIHNEGIRAFKTSSSIFGYEHPWNNLTFTTDVFIPLTKNQVDKKINALKKYHSQNDKPYFQEQYINSLLIVRGTQIVQPFAESFELIRLFI
jgi:LmbE family N-acetylglucosaminyl deacetylase